MCCVELSLSGTDSSTVQCTIYRFEIHDQKLSPCVAETGMSDKYLFMNATDHRTVCGVLLRGTLDISHGHYYRLTHLARTPTLDFLYSYFKILKINDLL